MPVDLYEDSKSAENADAGAGLEAVVEVAALVRSSGSVRVIAITPTVVVKDDLALIVWTTIRTCTDDLMT